MAGEEGLQLGVPDRILTSLHSAMAGANAAKLIKMKSLNPSFRVNTAGLSIKD